MRHRLVGRLSALCMGVMGLAMGTGCSSDPVPVVTDSGVTDTGNTPDVPVADVPATGPTVRVTSPASGAMFPVGGATNITVAPSNFVFEPFPMMPGNVAGHGHFHIYLDNFDANDYLFADYQTTVPIVIPPNTTAGAHTLRVSLRNHDHSPITAGTVPTTTDFVLPIMVVAQNGPSVTISAPADSATVAAGGTLNFTIAVANFGLTAPSDTNQDGRGHYSVYLDDASGTDRISTERVATTFTATIPAGTTAGPHRVRISLRQNDETPVAGFPEASLRILVGP